MDQDKGKAREKDPRRMDSSKTLWHMDRVIDLFDKGQRVPPVHIDMGISKGCNERCVYCYGFFQNMNNKIIQRDPLLQTMRDAGEIGVRSIAIIGDGDPSYNPHWYDAMDEGKRAGLDLSTSTNGITLDTDAKRDNILRNSVWMRFNLSAGTEEGFKKVHQVPRFKQVVKNIEDLVAWKEAHGYECDVGLQAVFVPTLMAQEMVEEARLAVRTGVDYLVIKQCSLPDVKGESKMVYFDTNLYKSPEIIEKLQEAEALSTERTKIVVKWDAMNFFGSPKGTGNYIHCNAIPLLSEISGDGSWYPCGYMFGDKPEFEKYKFGNVHETRLKDMFESEKYWGIVREMKEEFLVGKECHGCCRQDPVNVFLNDYLDTPRGKNFI